VIDAHICCQFVSAGNQTEAFCFVSVLILDESMGRIRALGGISQEAIEEIAILTVKKSKPSKKLSPV
jgi:hypothetical protein